MLVQQRCQLKNIFLSQSFLSFRGARFSSRRNSRNSVFSLRSQTQDAGSEHEFADDESSIFEDSLSQRGSLFLPRRFDRRSSSSMSQCSFLSHLLALPNGIKRSSVDCSGVASLVGRNSLPASPVGLLLPTVTLDKASTGDNVRKHLLTPDGAFSFHFLTFFSHLSLMFSILLTTGFVFSTSGILVLVVICFFKICLVCNTILYVNMYKSCSAPHL